MYGIFLVYHLVVMELALFQKGPESEQLFQVKFSGLCLSSVSRLILYKMLFDVSSEKENI